MWGTFTGWLPGLAKTLEGAEPGIVHTPADMQAESDTPDPAPAQAEPRPEQPPERPAVSSVLPPANTPAPAAHRDLRPSITANLRAKCQTLRRERDDARAEALRNARMLAEEQRQHAHTRALLDAAQRHIGFISGSPYDTELERSTTSGGVGGPSGSATAGAVDGCAGPVRLGEADRTGGPARDH